mmetsp:Transcript_71053/g.213718  ORF Transcript_71053/g.213718 Transcript_71053/m.213718 type:complete len:260 (+) Transcript_71053:1287-2066(+)
MSIASWLSINSQTPSDASTMQRSAAVTSVSVISGSAYTPSSATAWSPIERAIARPGPRPYAPRHTRAGPYMSDASETKPPLDSMRTRSLGSSGFWSTDSGIADHGPPEAGSRPITARESPTHAAQMRSVRMTHTIAVVPDSYEGTSRFLRKRLSASTICLNIAPLGSAVRAGMSASSSSMTSNATNSEQYSPCWPCPSYTAISICWLSSARGYWMTPRSWLILAAEPKPAGLMPWLLWKPMSSLGKGDSASFADVSLAR